MEGDSNIPRTPWSRNLAVSPKKSVAKETTLDWKYNNYKRRQAAFDSRRKAKSESNLLNSCKVGMITKEDSLDSQSDPGSASPTSSSQHGYHNDGKDTKRKPKLPVHGKGGGEKVQLRRRKGVRYKVGAIENQDFIMEIPIQGGKLADGDVFNIKCPRYVHTYFDFIYYCCMTPNKWDKTANDQQTKCRYALAIIQKIIYCYITIMATFSSFNEVKYQFVNFLDERTLHQLIDVGYFLVGCGIHWCTTYYFVFRHDAILKLLQIWDNYDAAHIGDNQTQTRNNMQWMPVITGIGTITMSLIKSISYTDFDKWSLKGLILENSEDTAYCIFLWHPDQFYSNSFTEDYGTNLNWTTCTMGIFGLMATISWNLSVDLFKDLLIWIAFVNKHHMLQFGNKIKQIMAQKRDGSKNLEESDDQCWEAYREVLELNSVTNSTFGFIFLINHLHSFLVFSYWLTQVLNKRVTLRVLILVGYNVVKGVFSYFPAQRASGESERCRKWIQNLSSAPERFRVENTSYTRELMLMELEKEPLGLGRGKVHINDEFLCSFTTLVLSLFCFLLNIKPKNEEETLIY